MKKICWNQPDNLQKAEPHTVVRGVMSSEISRIPFLRGKRL